MRNSVCELTECKAEDTSIRELDHEALDAVSGGMLALEKFFRALLGRDNGEVDDALNANRS